MSLTEQTFLVLTALASGDKHGYGIIREVETLSDGALTLRPGTLYAALDRLTGDGVIEPAGEDIVEGRFRRYYRLTAEGRELLAAEAKRMSLRANQARRVLRIQAAGA